MSEKLKVLMIGGTGIISSDCTLLAAQKEIIDLTLLNRGKNPSFLPEGIQTIQADINDAAAALAGREFDVVCDFISYTPEALQAKLDLFKDRCRQYVFISSVAAYAVPEDGAIRTEANTPVGCLDWSYGYNKALCERLLRESGIDYTIVRPAYTINSIRFFNPYTINHWESWTIADRLLTHRPLVLQDDGMQLCTMTHTTDFAEAFVGLWGNPKAMNEDFHLTSGEYRTWRQVAEIQAELLGVEPRFCFVPTDRLCLELRWDAAEKVRHTARHACYDSGKVRRAVPGFRCKVDFREMMTRSLRFYRENPEFQKISPWWSAAFDRIAAKYSGKPVLK